MKNTLINLTSFFKKGVSGMVKTYFCMSPEDRATLHLRHVAALASVIAELKNTLMKNRNLSEVIVYQHPPIKF